MRSTWTDSRLDDLNGRVGDLGSRMDAGFEQVNGRIDSLQHTIIQVGGALGAAFVALIAAMLGLIATQL
jgi:hypothetical protein